MNWEPFDQMGFLSLMLQIFSFQFRPYSYIFICIREDLKTETVVTVDYDNREL